MSRIPLDNSENLNVVHGCPVSPELPGFRLPAHQYPRLPTYQHVPNNDNGGGSRATVVRKPFEDPMQRVDQNGEIGLAVLLGPTNIVRGRRSTVPDSMGPKSATEIRTSECAARIRFPRSLIGNLLFQKPSSGAGSFHRTNSAPHPDSAAPIPLASECGTIELSPLTFPWRKRVNSMSPNFLSAPNARVSSLSSLCWRGTARISGWTRLGVVGYAGRSHRWS